MRQVHFPMQPTSDDPSDAPTSADSDPETKDGLEHVSDVLVELWKDYKSSHLPNLIYSVAFVGGVLTLGNTSELFKRVSDDGRAIKSRLRSSCESRKPVWQ